MGMPCSTKAAGGAGRESLLQSAAVPISNDEAATLPLAQATLVTQTKSPAVAQAPHRRTGGRQQAKWRALKRQMATTERRPLS